MVKGGIDYVKSILKTNHVLGNALNEGIEDSKPRGYTPHSSYRFKRFKLQIQNQRFKTISIPCLRNYITQLLRRYYANNYAIITHFCVFQN